MKNILLIKVSDANYIRDYEVELTFNDGLKSIIDLKDEIWGEVFQPLRDINYFKIFSQDRWTIGWECGADFAPEYLYELAMNQKEEAQNKGSKAMQAV